MPKAYSLIREAPWYRRQAFEVGLQRAGYEVLSGSAARGKPGDVLLVWNRYGGHHEIALQFERAGGTVLVAENGYLGKGGSSPKFDVHPHGPKPEHYYALSIGWHNGRGRWPNGEEDRFAALGVELAPWRNDGEHVLVCPNRSFGVGEQVMHPDWGARCMQRLRKQTKRPIRIRDHPGNDRPKRGVEVDLQGAWAVVVWSSTVGVHALAAGIPTFVEAPFWVMKGASASGTVDAPKTPDRLPHFRSMAWQQWKLAEIETGEPFSRLLSAAG